MIVDADQTSVSTNVTQHYETMRTAALGEGAAFDARNGLALFLRRGMWGWAQAIRDHDECQRSTPSAHSGARVDDDDNKQIVQLFAAMAMSSAAGRNRERSS